MLMIKMQTSYHGWIPLVKKDDILLVATRSKLGENSSIPKDIYTKNQPIIGLFYDDWHSTFQQSKTETFRIRKNGKDTKKSPKRLSRHTTRTAFGPIDRQALFNPDSTILMLVTLLLGLSLVLLAFLLWPRLENHPMCGVTTGGKEECYFDCTVVSTIGSGQLIENLPCLQDCFLTGPDSCLTSLLNDVINNGICNLPLGPGIYPFGECVISGSTIISGTCTDTTGDLLKTEECRRVVFEQQSFVWATLLELIYNSCTDDVGSFYSDFQISNLPSSTRNLPAGRSIDNITTHQRYAPVQQIYYEGSNIRTKLQFENTRHRYPWVCSLRSKGSSAAHRCAVNLLSIPPSPTVVVGAAHCTYLCKDGGREVPACCCSVGPDDCSQLKTKCGDDPGVVEMTGDDSFLLCGEWDSSQAGKEASGERYNIELPIKEIIRHPDFDPAKGPINGNDIVVFKIDDFAIKNDVANNLQLWPSCLPSQTSDRPVSGIHTGWSEPPPFSFVQAQASGYVPYYNDFYKQWHYKMEVLDTCEDPTESAVCSGFTFAFPSNSSYPAGSVCAKDFSKQSCFSTGESGSPLMAKDETNSDRLYIEGILSFVKGCDRFQFGEFDNADSQTNWILTQQTENPSTYTKLSCFLPWIAKQYKMIYDYSGPLDQACTTGSGDPLDGEKKTCRNTPADLLQCVFDNEVECKFPFYYNGKKYDECILLQEGDLTYPIFRCPTRDITTKIDGINSFEFTTLVDKYCLLDATDLNSPLDPTIPIESCSPFGRRAPFSQCKNNCPGVRAFGIVGGGAVLASVAFLGGLGVLAPLAGVGVAVGVGAVGGGLMVAQSMCATPYCETTSGQCCLLVFSVNGLVCPTLC